MDAHQKLGVLRKRLRDDATSMLKSYQMSEQDKKLLKRLNHILHSKEHAKSDFFDELQQKNEK